MQDSVIEAGKGTTRTGSTLGLPGRWVLRDRTATMHSPTRNEPYALPWTNWHAHRKETNCE